MSNLKHIVLLILGVGVGWYTLSAKPIELPAKDSFKMPPRIIRACCSFGYNLRLKGIPFVKISQIVSRTNVGNHKYLGGNDERNGIIYSRLGGFIDMAHLRDQADKTAYFYSLFTQIKNEGFEKIKLAKEGGKGTLYLKSLNKLSPHDIAQLAGRVSYDLSVWHEIATGFGVSSIPLISERFSSFSVEDVYSNLLGVILGIKAIESDLPYEEAMTKFIDETLCNLEGAKTESETIAAYDLVKYLWWTNEVGLPDNGITLARNYSFFPDVIPMLIPDSLQKTICPAILSVPVELANGEPLTSYYTIKYIVGRKFPASIKREITQNDFAAIIDEISKVLSN